LSPTVTAIIVIVVGMVLLGIIWAVASIMKSAPSDVSAGSTPARTARDQLRPILLDFHVRGDVAEIYYAVLRDLMCHDASLVLHEKRSHGLPIAQVTKARVYGRRGEEAVVIDVMDLEAPGDIPEIAAPELVPHASATGFDPLTHLGEQEFEVQPGVADRPSEEDLAPFLDEIVIAKPVEAQLRAAGIDPTNVSLRDLALALLRTAGYEVVVGRVAVSTVDSGSAEVYTARKAGLEVLVAIVPHHEGEHPELPEQIVNMFVIEVAHLNLVHEKERSDPRCRFITRGRLQAFVDGFSIQ